MVNKNENNKKKQRKQHAENKKKKKKHEQEERNRLFLICNIYTSRKMLMIIDEMGLIGYFHYFVSM